MINKNFIFALSLLLIINFATESFAFGVVSPYFEGNDFLIAPGEVKTAKLNLQNMVGNEDIKVKVVMIKNDGVGSVNEQVYLVRAKTGDTAVPINIRIPNNAPVGATYSVIVGFESVKDGGDGAVSFGTGIETKIPIRVVEYSLSPEEEPPKTNSYKIILITLAVIILITIIIFWLIARKKKMQG